jgi:lysyl endopeptidase
LRASEANADFALLELNQTPDPSLGIFYAGWTRSGQPASSVTAIHHPKGDLMKISIDVNPVIAVSFFGGGPDYWRATFDQGIVQPGSSGSPLFDPNHRIVGQLSGYQNDICNINDNPCYCTEPTHWGIWQV